MPWGRDTAFLSLSFLVYQIEVRTAAASPNVHIDHACGMEQALNTRQLLLGQAGCELLQASLPLSSLPTGLSHTAWPTTGVYYAERNRREETFADLLTASICEFKCISHSQSLTINLFRRRNMYTFLRTDSMKMHRNEKYFLPSPSKWCS